MLALQNAEHLHFGSPAVWAFANRGVQLFHYMVAKTNVQCCTYEEIAIDFCVLPGTCCAL